MIKLEDIKRGVVIRGLLPDRNATIVDVEWHGQSAIEIYYNDSQGNPGRELIYRDKENSLEIVQFALPWTFNADSKLFRLVSEAYRIKLGYLFDPLLAVHTSNIEPFPHQITAVYQDMLPRQPLRYVLADDPGAGKTIMAGLLIKELIARGDLKRCLVVAPGNLVEQWQDELRDRLNLEFRVLLKEDLENPSNAFIDNPLAIARLDKLSRDEQVQQKLLITDWDLIICDEAHKMSASLFGGEIKYTKRHKLGQLLSKLCRHFLLLTATPHNGKDEDFQLFMTLIDPDRFEGKYRKDVHTSDVSDLIRRMQKEKMLKFDGTKLFPPRYPYSVNYELSEAELDLYRKVTEYVTNEFNRADALENENQKGTIGFALTILQRRLASSPGAIYASLKRRRERLEKRLREEKSNRGSSEVQLEIPENLPLLSEDDIEDFDDAPDSEVDEIEEKIVDQATAAQTITELEAEIAQLIGLENLAAKVKASGKDRKWDELSKLLNDTPEMREPSGSRSKLIIFTEHKDTLNYLVDKIRSCIGNPEAVAVIHGGMTREVRKTQQELFTNDKDVIILVATDAAGEGINLQKAHLMINYDLPWNPNRIEQRFGRIHRIGQDKECYLWNVIASETREGEVYKVILDKLEAERKALGDCVFDVLGMAIDGKELRRLLIEAIRHGDQPEIKGKIKQVVADALDHERLKELLEEKALAHEVMDPSAVFRIKEQMERAEARKLQPHFIASFFIEAFKMLGGSIKEREPKRYEITHVPAVIRNNDAIVGLGKVVVSKYERICFEKELIDVEDKPKATFVCPGHPLLDSTISIILDQNKDLLKQGSVLVDESDANDKLRLLLYLEHSIQDATLDRSGNRRVISKQVQFLEVTEDKEVLRSGYAPYLNYRFLRPGEEKIIKELTNNPLLKAGFEDLARTYAINKMIPEHLSEIKNRKEFLIEKTKKAVKDRLTKEINYWDHRAEELKAQELNGKVNAKINSGKARQRADSLQERLVKRLEELEKERNISPLPPVVIGGAVIMPKGLLNKITGHVDTEEKEISEADRKIVELKAMEAVMQHERSLGREPKDVSSENLGYDVESKDKDGSLIFIEVKGRHSKAKTVTVTKNEIITALNKPNHYILALVLVDEKGTRKPKYIYQFIKSEPDFAVTSINYDIERLLSDAKEWVVKIN